MENLKPIELNATRVPANRAAVLVLGLDVKRDAPLFNKLSRSCELTFADSPDHYFGMVDKKHNDLVLIFTSAFDADIVKNVTKLRECLGPSSATRIVTISEFSPGAFSTFLKQAGCDECLTEPCNENAILDAIDPILNGSGKRKTACASIQNEQSSLR